MRFRRTFATGTIVVGVLHVVNELFLSVVGPLNGDSQSTQSDRLNDFFGLSWWRVLRHYDGWPKWYYGGLVVFNYGVIVAVVLAIVVLATPHHPAAPSSTANWEPPLTQAPVPPGIELP
jgi:hypothetical protein